MRRPLRRPHFDDVKIESATRGDAQQAIDALVLAFARDPIARWFFPHATQHSRGFEAFAHAFGGAAFDSGTAFATQGLDAVALWLRPGSAPDEAATLACFERWVPEERLEQGLEIMEQMGKYHPEEPYWYLPLIGVDPALQGRGFGAALLRHALAIVDGEEKLAYLESTNPANLSLYRRHGFEVLTTIQIGAAPPVFPMLREPR
jgi:ribosomal protein S18 acetylase RimI-like enzyme